MKHDIPSPPDDELGNLINRKHYRARTTEDTLETDLLSKLRLWDGVRVEYLKELYIANSSSIDFFDKLISICVNEQDLQNAATWLIKHHYDNGQTIPEFLAERLLIGCKYLENWKAKLHVLQIIPHVTLSKK